MLLTAHDVLDDSKEHREAAGSRRLAAAHEAGERAQQAADSELGLSQLQVHLQVGSDNSLVVSALT